MADVRHQLTEFGFNQLESEIYVFLLAEHPATGYRVAQALGKPAANVYKAIQTLEAKGAVEADGEETKAVRPVAASELLARLDREFRIRHAQASKAFAGFFEPAPDDRIRTLRSEAACLARAARLLGEARETVVGVLDPEHREELEDAEGQAKGRNVRVRLLARPGGEIRLAADHRRAIVGAHDAQGYLAYTGDHPTFAGAVHHGILAEIAVSDVRREIEQGGGGKRFSRILSELEDA